MDWSELLFNALNAVLAVVVPVLAGYAIKLASAWIGAKVAEKKAQMSTEQIYLLNQFVETAVFAAEQMWKAAEGKKKLEYAYTQVVQWMSDNDIPVDLDRVRLMIEAEVYRQFNREKSTASAINGYADMVAQDVPEQ